MIPAHAQTTASLLEVSAYPPPGATLAVGETIQDLTCTVDPMPEPGQTISYIVVCGDTVRGPFTLPLDPGGKARSFLLIENDYAGQSEITVRWKYRGSIVDTVWKLA